MSLFAWSDTALPAPDETDVLPIIAIIIFGLHELSSQVREYDPIEPGCIEKLPLLLKLELTGLILIGGSSWNGNLTSEELGEYPIENLLFGAGVGREPLAPNLR